jgi:hypothetical protein
MATKAAMAGRVLNANNVQKATADQRGALGLATDHAPKHDAMPMSDPEMVIAHVKSASESKGEFDCNLAEDPKVNLVPEGVDHSARRAAPPRGTCRRCSLGSTQTAITC